MQQGLSLIGFYTNRSRMLKVVLIGILLIATILAVYMQAGNHQFLSFDDDSYVTCNPHVASGINGNNIRWAFTSVEEANWHPITWLSHMTDVHFHGLNPRGHHLTNVVIHTASSLLLLILLLRLTGQLWQSSFVAALFALHPLHVESVAWVAERKDLLSAFFWFLTLLLYVEFTAKQKHTLYVLSLFSFVLGLMSKPMLVTLPLVMLLIDYWPLERFSHEGRKSGFVGNTKKLAPLIKEKIPYFICSLISCIVSIYAQHAGGAMPGLETVSIGLRINNALTAYAKYIGKTFWPHDLAVYYPFPLSIPLWQVMVSLLILLILSIAVVRIGHCRPYLPVGWLWFLVTLVPVIGFVQIGGQSMADRYSYIPIIGLFIMVAWGIPDLARGLQYRRAIIALLAVFVVTASAALTWQQLGYWRDNISLYRHTLRVTTNNYLINYNLGMALAKAGLLEAAIGEYKEAIRINPNHIGAHNNLGIALAIKGDMDAAIKQYREALRLSPNDMEVHNNLGVALANKNDLKAAIQEFRKALLISPNYKDAHDNLERALAQE